MDNRPTIKQLEYEQKLAKLRKEYATAAPSRQQIIKRLMVPPLIRAWEEVTGRKYQKPQTSLGSPKG